MNITLLKNGNYNIARLDFQDINLLESSHRNGCNGAVIFTINTDGNLPPGADISNHAGIFFDYNSVVMTNTATTTIGGCTALNIPQTKNNSQSAAIYPNPATNELTIKMDKDAYNSFTISNSIGQGMVQQQLTQTQTNINVKALPPGLYYISPRGDNGSKVMKFVRCNRQKWGIIIYPHFSKSTTCYTPNP